MIDVQIVKDEYHFNLLVKGVDGSTHFREVGSIWQHGGFFRRWWELMHMTADLEAIVSRLFDTAPVGTNLNSVEDRTKLAKAIAVQLQESQH